jgi:hypothetical protein
MKSLIKQILREELSSREVILFDALNSKKTELKTKSNIINYIEDLCKYMSLDPKMAQYYYLLWKANYKKEGGYKNMSPEEFVGPKDLPQRTISNPQSGNFVRSKAPFKGSNIEGRWGTDKNGVDYYVVISYRWYPVYLFKQDKWYRTSNTYSSSTLRQMNNADPIGYDDNIERDFTWVTKPEMDALMYGTATHSDIMKGKVKNLVNKKEDFINKRPKFAYEWSYLANHIPMKARFKVTDIREEGDKAVIDVTIDDAGLRERRPTNGQLTNKMVPSNGGYLRGDVEGVTKEKVENMIKNYILVNFKDYVGKFPNYKSDTGGYDIETTPEKHAIKFNFIHSKA